MASNAHVFATNRVAFQPTPLAWGPFSVTPFTFDQVYFLVTLACYLPTVILLWRSWVMKPFKQWAACLHEFSHALGAWATCNSVTSIEVHGDEGGLTRWKGNNVECGRHVVLPAGYMGSCFWGCLIVFSCCDPIFMQVVALLLCVALLICLLYAFIGQTEEAPDRLPLIILSLSFTIVIGGVATVCFFLPWHPLLEALMLWLGALNIVYATLDIYDDTVARTDERSDAYQYAKLWGPCCFAKCVGAIWLTASVFVLLTVTGWTWTWLARSEGEVNWHALLPGPIVLSLAVLLRIGLGFVGAGAGEEKPLLPDGGKDKRGFDEAKATDFLRSKVMGNV